VLVYIDPEVRSAVPRRLEGTFPYIAEVVQVVDHDAGSVVGPAGMAREKIVSRPALMTWMRRTFAVAFLAVAAKLALAQR